eukprot:3304772-Prymnesium_polylepis.1
MPDMRAQKGPVQGQGMLGSAQAAPTGLQPGSGGRAGGCGGLAVSPVFFICRGCESTVNCVSCGVPGWKRVLWR